MKIISTLLISLLFLESSGQNMLPEVVVVSYLNPTVGFQNSKQVSKEINNSSSSKLTFPVNKSKQPYKQMLCYLGCGCMCAPKKIEPDSAPHFVFPEAVSFPSRDTLLIINGVIENDKGVLKTLDPEKIESVNIIDAAKISPPIGCRNLSGLIVIVTTKRYQETMFRVNDVTDGAPVSRATFTFAEEKNGDTVRLVANDEGRLTVTSLKRGIEYALTVTAAGYVSRSVPYKIDYYKTGPVEIFLNRNVNTLSEVVIVSNIDYRKIRCGIGSIRVVQNKEAIPGSEPFPVNLFPNPARAGQVCTIEKEFKHDEIIQVRIIKSDGAIVRSKQHKAVEGINRINIETAPAWAKGTYFIQLLCANGRVLASKPLIIQ